MSPHELLVARIRGEYSEMPGLRLTFAQACRLWQINSADCEQVLHTLIEEHFLARTADGAFVASPTRDEHSAPVNAMLRSATETQSPLSSRRRA
jgi:hypothetical protein